MCRTTHYTGCECYEAHRRAEVEELRNALTFALVAMQKAADAPSFRLEIALALETLERRSVFSRTSPGVGYRSDDV